VNIRSLFSVFSSDLAIDLGTSNTLVYARGRGIVVNEPSMVVVDHAAGTVEAIGTEAHQMLGRTPQHLTVISPLKEGVIADFNMTERMLKYFVQKAHGRRTLVHPRIVVSVPSEITQVERRAVIDAAYRANASEVFLVDQAMMAAIGAGLPITEPSGSMVLDIGGGTTNVAMVSLAGIVYSRSVRIGGNTMDEDVIRFVRHRHNLLIGETTAETIKIAVGSAWPLDKPLKIEATGRDLVQGLPGTVVLTDADIREALADSVSTVISAVHFALEVTPPELSADLCDRGIILTGGGALLKNLDQRIREETGLPVIIADAPQACVVLGTGRLLDDFRLLRKVAIE
jgi:rod shape-determining protein MreB